MKLGGKVRNFRFRAHELSLLEKKMGMGIFSALDGGNLGITFLRDALTVGVAHEFIGKRGKLKEALTDEVVAGWIDDCEEKDGIPFDVLLQTVVRGVVSGLPGGASVLDDDGDEGNDESAES